MDNRAYLVRAQNLQWHARSEVDGTTIAASDYKHEAAYQANEKGYYIHGFRSKKVLRPIARFDLTRRAA